MRKSEVHVTPRNGAVRAVIAVTRLSGGPRQKEDSREDQQDHARDIVADEYQGPAEYRFINRTVTGERLDRPELKEIEDLLRPRAFDRLACADLGRLVRGTAATDLFGIALGHGTRAMAPHDGVDTADDTWAAADWLHETGGDRALRPEPEMEWEEGPPRHRHPDPQGPAAAGPQAPRQAPRVGPAHVGEEPDGAAVR